MLSQLCGRIEARGCCEDRFESHAGLPLGNRVAVVIFLLFALGLHVRLVAAQGLDPAALLRPATDAWPTYNGDYSGRRFSTLDQINAGNVGSLGVCNGVPDEIRGWVLGAERLDRAIEFALHNG